MEREEGMMIFMERQSGIIDIVRVGHWKDESAAKLSGSYHKIHELAELSSVFKIAFRSRQFTVHPLILREFSNRVVDLLIHSEYFNTAGIR